MQLRYALLAPFAVVLLLATPVLAQPTPESIKDDAATMNACLDSEEMVRPADCIGAVSNACQAVPGGGSTIGMVKCMERETAFWNTLIEDRYQSLAETLTQEAFEVLQTAQDAWIAFRDAECAFQYTLWGDGSLRAIAGASCGLQTTAERALALDAALLEQQT